MDRHKEYYLKNKGKELARMQAYYARTKEQRKKVHAEWRLKNKDLANRLTKEWAQKNKRRILDTRLRKRYGISFTEFSSMLETQLGLCAICNSQLNGKTEPCVDHCHKTGKVRGLLCRRCNLVLGQVEDNLNIMEKAIDYLNR